MNHEEIFISAVVTFVPDKSCLVSLEHGNIHLTPNERRLLELIICGKSKKETILEEIWLKKGTIVSESSYHQLIKMLRRKLQSSGLPSNIIKTIPRYGIVLDKMPDESCRSEEACIDNAMQDIVMANPPLFSRLYFRLLLVFITLMSMSAPFFIVLSMENSQAFQEKIMVEGVTFHFNSPSKVDQTDFAKIRQALPDKINNVYIDSNGPKVFVAQCEGEWSKEGKCNYEYYSSY